MPGSGAGRRRGLAERSVPTAGSWRAWGDVIPDGFGVYIGLEETASQLVWYESGLAPGRPPTED